MTSALSPGPYRTNAPGLQHLLTVVLLLTGPTFLFADDQESERLEAYHYRPSEQLQESVNKTLEIAKSEQKLAIIALGAEWCHDSRALGARFSEPSMQEILGEHYVTQFADVGYLEDRREILEPLGYPINFGTPTVLVIDPESGTLINFAQVSMWQSADSVPLDEYENYFSSLAEDFKAGTITPLDQPASDELQAFTSRNVERLMAGYTALGPMLADYDADLLESNEAFEALWVEVREFRAQLQKDLTAMRLAENAQANPAEEVEWPEYGPLSWEQPGF